MSCIERSFDVRGIQLAAKHWNSESGKPVIALHGWLDNAASFDVIAPLLAECSVLAFDQAGVGRSGFRPPSSTYHLWDDLLDILEIADSLGWEKFSLLGHSRGAALAIMLAATHPERVTSLGLIDGLMPLPVDASGAPKQMSDFLRGYRAGIRQGRGYASMQELVDLRALASSVDVSIAQLLGVRAIEERDGRFYWRVDSRLKQPSAVKLTESHNQAFLQKVQCRVFVFLASQGLGSYDKLQAMLSDLKAPLWNVMRLDGHHHLHMDFQAKEISEVCCELFV
ncbi:Tropinesterase [BD1-7 clade bacterium]|uniref:Tropinesterase n=1 Tax=BD1-7 clade bacterium TaxID=2029982 RepID=A0A5S9QLJ5_9GAMM|nr:Tropinesterase [BD1-7 clade bacterium]CAA0120456.1 Tropinesterase [BD1-7 clade bacterium]